MKNSSEIQIECKDVTLSYDGRRVLRNTSFSVEQGDFLLIVGENGSGKSTLVKALLSLKHPTDGEIIFSDTLNKRKIGYLPQQTSIQKDFPATVREVVLSGRLAKGPFKPFYSAADKRSAEENMEKMGITDIANTPYRDLSGGQKQRVLLARALCSAEEMIILDEPVSGLDPLVTKEIYKIIEKLNREDGMTVIMISHDIPSAMRYATKILHLDHSVKFFGSKDDYLSSPTHRALGGGESDE